MIKIGSMDFDAIKVGDGDVDKIYAGDTLIYTSEHPTPKWLATYSDSSTSSAECDSTSAITEYEIDGDIVSVGIYDCVTSIGNSAFDGLTSLVSVTIPSSVTTIGNSAFGHCDSLTSITIPDSVTSIGDTAFYRCRQLTSVIVNAVTPPTLGSGAFNATNNCPIYVPSSSVDAYKAASGWSSYADRIQAIQT